MQLILFILTVLDSPLSKNVQATYCLEIGDFHFFSNFIIAEFKQGANVSFEDFSEIYELSIEFFGSDPYGFISNRVNSYSINLLDVIKHKGKGENLKANAIVTYNYNTVRVLAIEDHYFNSKRERFKSLIDAANWVKETILVPLN
jgi:hypothetical protein